MNLVANAFPFQRICDWGTKPLPLTVRTTEFAVTETTLGDNNVIWGGADTPRQVLKPMIAVQVQPDSVKAKTVTKLMRSHGKVVADWIR